MNTILKQCYLAVALVLVVLILSQSATASNIEYENPTSRVIIVDLGGLTIEEINRYPFYNLQEIIRAGAIGLMNTSTAGPRNRENGFITIGSGIISRWGNTSPLIYSTSGLHNEEKAGQIYERLIGEIPYIGGAVVLDIAQSSGRVREPQRRHWGRLGDILKENDLSSVVIGNSGYMDLIQNQMALMFMDNKGRIPTAYFDTINEMGLGVLSYFTDYNRIHAIFRRYPDASVIGIDIGDWNRLQLVQEKANPILFQETKNDVVQHIDLFLYNLVQDLNPDSDLLIMLSPAPTREQNRLRNLMVPIILWGKGIEPGILTSATTRREGIIANLDILPTILSTLNLDSRYHLVGRPAVSQTTKYETLACLTNMNHDMHFIYSTRPTLVRGYIFLQIIILAIAMVMIFFIPRFLSYLKIPLLFLMSVPFALLLVGLFPIISLNIYTAIVLSIAFSLVAISLFFERLKTKSYNHVLSPFILIGLVTSLAILIDLSLGASLMQRSTLGYDALAGARYYGLGNEYMGVLIGASIIGISGLLDKFKTNKYVLGISSIYLLATVYLIASPNWGSNLGGTIAAVMGFSYLIYQLSMKRITIPQIAAAGVFGSAFVLLLAILDSTRDINAQSHFGRTATMVLADGFQPLYEIIIRKVDMNIRLIRYTIWSRVFLLGMAALIIIVFFKPIYLIQKLKDNFSQIYHGLFAIILASIIALLANDSGIVAAATMLIYAVAPLLYLGGLLYNSEKIIEKS